MIVGYCFIPNAKIVEFCKKKKIPNICFPKGLKDKYKEFNQLVNPDGINIDYEIDPQWAKDNLKNVVLQIKWHCGRVARQGSAKACTAVRIRSVPQNLP